MLSAKKNILIEKGASFVPEYVFTVRDNITGVETPIDFTGWQMEAMVRGDIDSPDVELTMSTANGLITCNAQGKVKFHVPHITTSAMEIDTGVWALEGTTPTGERFRMLEGTVKLTPELVR